MLRTCLAHGKCHLLAVFQLSQFLFLLFPKHATLFLPSMPFVHKGNPVKPFLVTSKSLKPMHAFPFFFLEERFIVISLLWPHFHSGFKHVGVILNTKLLSSSAAAFFTTSKLSSFICLVCQSTILFWHLLCSSIKIKFLSTHTHSGLTNQFSLSNPIGFLTHPTT